MQTITGALRDIGSTGSFVSKRSAPAQDLLLEVAGFGRVRLPASAATERKLIALAQPACHGYRDETRLDRRVRDSFEIDGQRISLLGEAWQQLLNTQLEHIRRDLGLAAGYRLRAELDKLLIYGPGQHFVSHQDSEKDDAMLASLVVGLPSLFSGGALVIMHAGVEAVVRCAAQRLTFTAFYTDCRHEVQPVKHGYRLSLGFHLLLEGAPELAAPASTLIAVLGQSVSDYFATPLPPRWAGDEPTSLPDRLVYLLDHQYTQRGLGWSRLKGTDGPRAAALQEVAAMQDCEIRLALVDVHETWNCPTDPEADWNGRRSTAVRDDEDEDGEYAVGPLAFDIDADDLDELIESEASLQSFKGSADAPLTMPSTIDQRELCYTRPSIQCDPYESEYEGYMGNYGNTMDRWYHRAAVILWPRSRGFIMRAKIAPRWALTEVAKTLTASGKHAAITQAQILTPIWAQAVRQARNRALFRQTLKLSVPLDEPVIAEALLAPFTLLQLKAASATLWQRCLNHYGQAWSRAMLAHWQAPPNAPQDERLRWLASDFKDLSHSLQSANNGPGATLASALAHQEWEWLGSVWRARASLPRLAMRAEAMAALGPALAGLLKAALGNDDHALRDSMLAALCRIDGQTPCSPGLALGVLRAAHAGVGTALRCALDAVVVHWKQHLDAQLAQPARRSDDWSISASLNCRCDLCRELGRFLQDPMRIRHDWPLVEAQRRHVHSIIDAHELPVTHITRRNGRPYVLVLEKTQALFTQAAVEREGWRRDREWLAGVV